MNTVLLQPEGLVATAQRLYQSMSDDCRSLATHASFCAINPVSIIDVVRLIAPIMRGDVVAHLRAKLGHPTIHERVGNINSDEIEIVRAAELSADATLACHCSLVRFSIDLVACLSLLSTLAVRPD